MLQPLVFFFVVDVVRRWRALRNGGDARAAWGRPIRTLLTSGGRMGEGAAPAAARRVAAAVREQRGMEKDGAG